MLGKALAWATNSRCLELKKSQPYLLDIFEHSYEFVNRHFQVHGYILCTAAKCIRIG